MIDLSQKITAAQIEAARRAIGTAFGCHDADHIGEPCDQCDDRDGCRTAARAALDAAHQASDQRDPETFRQFYERTTGYPYAGVAGEQISLVMARIADVLAAWADEIARRAGN